MHIVDLMFLFLLFLVLPVYSTWSYRTMQAKIAGGVVPDRVPLYRQTMLMQWSALCVLLATWFLLARPFSDLGMRSTDTNGLLIGLGITVLLVGGLGFQLIQVRRLDTPAKAAQLKHLGELTYALPQTRRDYIWANWVSLTAGVVEEIVYRGFVIWWLQFYMPLWAAAIVSSIAFGLAHAYQGLMGVVKTGVIGGVFALIYVLTDTIWIPVLLHFLFDALQMATVRELFIDRARKPASG